MSEEWRPVVGYENRYEVSDKGKVRSLLSGKRRELKQNPDTHGHLAVNLYNGSRATVKKNYTHVMVAASFIGPRPKGKQVCHGPLGIKVNTIRNLYYGYPSENGLDRRRDNTAGRRVFRSDGITFPNAKAAADEMNKAHSAIYYACEGKRKTAYGYKWEYINAN